MKKSKNIWKFKDAKEKSLNLNLNIEDDNVIVSICNKENIQSICLNLKEVTRLSKMLSDLAVWIPKKDKGFTFRILKGETDVLEFVEDGKVMYSVVLKKDEFKSLKTLIKYSLKDIDNDISSE